MQAGLCAAALAAAMGFVPEAAHAARPAPPPVRLTLPTGPASRVRVHTPDTVGVAVTVRNLLRRPAEYTLRGADLRAPNGTPAGGLVVLRWTPGKVRLGPRAGRTVTLWLTPRPAVPTGTYRLVLEAWLTPPQGGVARAGRVVLRFTVAPAS
jgi:hypothetical protein